MMLHRRRRGLPFRTVLLLLLHQADSSFYGALIVVWSGVFAGEPKASAKATAKTKGKAKAKAPAAMKSGIFELNKCRSSDLKEALPRFNRAETKKSMQKEILDKVGL